MVGTGAGLGAVWPAPVGERSEPSRARLCEPEAPPEGPFLAAVTRADTDHALTPRGFGAERRDRTPQAGAEPGRGPAYPPLWAGSASLAGAATTTDPPVGRESERKPLRVGGFGPTAFQGRSERWLRRRLGWAGAGLEPGASRRARVPRRSPACGPPPKHKARDDCLRGPSTVRGFRPLGAGLTTGANTEGGRGAVPRVAKPAGCPPAPATQASERSQKRGKGGILARVRRPRRGVAAAGRTKAH